MNMAWLAAVLQPRDVIRHPNVRSMDADTSGVAHLAGLVMGGDWLRGFDDDPADPEIAEDLRIAGRCLAQGGIGDAVYRLANRLHDRPPPDEAQGVALAIFLSAAGAELDDFQIGFDVLEAQLERLGLQNETSDVLLLRAAVYQQLGLRARDAGKPFSHYLLDVARSLNSLVPSECSSFRTSRGVAWSSTRTVEQMRDSLLKAASGLYPSDQPIPSNTLLTRFELVKQSWSSAESRAWSMQAHEYAGFVERQFERWSGDTRRHLGGRRNPDIFHALLGLEMVGSRMVYPARKNLALMRLTQGEGDSYQMADAVRLLRHSGSASELSHALRRLRAAGPLAALAHDARQVLTRRLDTAGLRTVEIELIAAGSDVLTKPEARRAIAAIERSLEAQDGPAGVVGQWQLQVLRRETAWKAIAALAGPASAERHVAERLLSELERVAGDSELADRGLCAAILRMDWKRVPGETNHAWTEAVEARREEFPATYDVLTSFSATAPEAVQEEAQLDRLASWVNAEIRGQRHDPDPPLDEAAVRGSLRKIRDNAANGRFDMGGTDVADIVAALLSTGHGATLWTDLAEFLMDRRVAKDDRTRAFDRLALARINVPTDAAEIIQRGAEDVLQSRAPGLEGDSEIVPYPALLRFLSVHRFMDAAESYGHLAKLAGSAGSVARREAARTIAVLASGAPHDDLLAFALPLSHDDDVRVRAQIAVSLARLATVSSALAPVARGRLLGLLEEDGLEIPLAAIRALKDAAVPLSRELELNLLRVRNSHPSRAVRIAAAELLGSRSGAGDA